MKKTELEVRFELSGSIVVPTAHPLSLRRLVARLARDGGIACDIEPVSIEDQEISLSLELLAPPQPVNFIRRVHAQEIIDLAETGLVSSSRHRFDVARGIYKPALRKIYVAPAHSATARCIADRAALARTLANVRQLGALRSHGYGEVKRVVIA